MASEELVRVAAQLEDLKLPEVPPTSLNAAVDELIQALEQVSAPGVIADDLGRWCAALHVMGKPDLAVVVRGLVVVLMTLQEQEGPTDG